MNKTAVLIGATGLVGSHLLKKLLNDKRYSRIITFGRRATESGDSKVSEITGDIIEPQFWEHEEQVDDIFCCIGTTRAKTRDLSIYKKIDMGVPVQAAQWGIRNGMKRFLVISAMGADKKSRIFYSRIKGMMEETLFKLDIRELYILRPSIIIGKRNEFRFGERLGLFFAKAFSPLIPPKYKGIEAATIAEAMLNLANHPQDQQIFESDEIRNFNS